MRSEQFVQQKWFGNHTSILARKAFSIPTLRYDECYGKGAVIRFRRFFVFSEAGFGA